MRRMADRLRLLPKTRPSILRPLAIFFALAGVAAAQPDPARKEFDERIRLFEAHDDSRAMGHFRRAARLDSAWAEPSFYLGLCEVRRRSFKQAVKRFREALKKEPGHGGATQWLQLVEDDDKLPFFGRFPERMPGDRTAAQITRFLESGGTVERIVSVLGLRAPLDPVRKYLFSHIFKELSEAEQWEAARSWSEAWLKMFPEERPSIDSNLGLVLLRKGERNEAEELCRRVLQLLEEEPDYAGSPLNEALLAEFGHSFELPEILESETPSYSEEAIRAKVEGIVLVAAVVEKNGVLSELQVVHPIGFGLDRRAVDSLTRWRFRPALLDGLPIRQRGIIEVTFNLR